MSKVISKVQITSTINQWWQSSLSDIFTNPEEVAIISAIEYDGGLYLIYSYDDPEYQDDESQKK